MKKWIAVLLLLVPIAAYAVNSKIQRSTSEQSSTRAPDAVTPYDRDCDGFGMGKGIRTITQTTASGVGYVYTFWATDGASSVPAANIIASGVAAITDGSSLWMGTTDTSVSGVVDSSCLRLQ